MTDTPPWLTDPWDLGADLAKIEQQWASIARILEDDELAARRDPEISDWSCGEQAAHALLIAATMAERIEGNLAEPHRHDEEQTQELALHVLKRGGFRRGIAKAPSEFRPDAVRPGERSALYASTVDAWRRLRSRADEIAGCPARARHFALGYLTSAEWVRMCAIHTAHHLRIARDIAGEDALLEA